MSSTKRAKVAPVVPMITTVSQHRLGIFPPVKILKKDRANSDFYVENAHGSCRLPDCKITQIHAGIIEACFAAARKIARADDGQVGVMVSFPDVLRVLELHPKNSTWLANHLKELEQQRIDATIKGRRIFSKIIRKIKESEEVVATHGNATPGKLYWVIFEPEFWEFFYQNDVGVDWRDHLPIIHKMSGPSQAVARYCLTHNSVNGERIANILEMLGQQWEGINREKLRQQSVRAVTQDAELFGDIGIAIDMAGPKTDDKKVHYSKQMTDLQSGKVPVRLLPAGRVFE